MTFPLDAPAGPTVLLDRVVLTDYGIFVIFWDWEGCVPDPDEVFRGQHNGIIGTGRSDCVYFFLAGGFGYSRVRVQVTKDEPRLLDAEWGDVVEVSVEFPTSEFVRWTTTQDLDGGELPEPAPGSYRVRLSELDRGAASRRPGTQDDPATDGLIELWPHSPEPDRIVRLNSASARSMHDDRH